MKKSPFTTVFVLAAAMFLCGCEGASGPPPTEPYKEPEVPKELAPDRDWKPLTTLTGSGSIASEVFEVTGTQVKLISTLDGASTGNKCSLRCWMVESSQTLESDKQSQVDFFQTQDCGDGQHVFYRGPGKYFFQIDATGSWKIELIQK